MTCALLLSPVPAKTIKDSVSPDGNFDIVAENQAKGISYHLEKKNGERASEDFASDFGMLRSLEEASSSTSVHWRPDGAYVALFTGHDRHHVDFFLWAKTRTGFKALPFDWEKLVEFSHRKPLGFAYPAFICWLPGDKVAVDLFEYDGKNDVRDSVFTLDVTDNLKPVSWTILKEEHKTK